MLDASLDDAYINDFIQTKRNRLNPDRVWLARHADILKLKEIEVPGAPMLLGSLQSGSNLYYTALHAKEAAIIAFSFGDFSPAVALRIASREWWEARRGSIL